jgi:hypothetical protein
MMTLPERSLRASEGLNLTIADSGGVKFGVLKFGGLDAERRQTSGFNVYLPWKQ